MKVCVFLKNIQAKANKNEKLLFNYTLSHHFKSCIFFCFFEKIIDFYCLIILNRNLPLNTEDIYLNGNVKFFLNRLSRLSGRQKDVPDLKKTFYFVLEHKPQESHYKTVFRNRFS